MPNSINEKPARLPCYAAQLVISTRANPLHLHPLSAYVMRRTAAGRPFTAEGLYFAPGWAGEAADYFPIYLLMLGDRRALRGQFVVAAGRQAAGLMGLKHQPECGTAEIGYGIAAGLRGRGYASGALALLLKEVATWPDVQELTAKTRPDNAASIRVLQKNGFARDGMHASLLLWRRPISDL